MHSLTPLAGNPTELHRASKRMADLDSRLSRAAQALRAMATGESVGDAIDAMKIAAADVAVVMDRASVRYASAARALDAYANDLQDAQTKARRAVDAYDSTDVGSAHHEVDRLQRERLSRMVNPLDHADPDADDELQRAQNRLHAQEQLRREAEQLYHEAEAQLDEAAHRAANAIALGNEASGLSDTWWDNVKSVAKDWFTEFADYLVIFLDALSDALALVAVLALIIYPPAAAVLFLASTLVGVASKLVEIGKMMVNGITLSQLISAVVGAVVGVVLSKLFKVGKVATRIASKVPLGKLAERTMIQQKIRMEVGKWVSGEIKGEVKGAVEDTLRVRPDHDSYLIPPLELLGPQDVRYPNVPPPEAPAESPILVTASVGGGR